MKVIKNTGTQSRTTSTIDVVSDLAISKKTAKEINQEVGEFLVEQVLLSVAAQKSPVSGEGWPALLPTSDYKNIKKKEVGNTKANMELHGGMLDALSVKATADSVEIGFFNDEAWKADGHLKFSGKTNSTPKRRFLPAEGQNFKQDIQKKVEQIILDKLAQNINLKSSELKNLSSSKQLYDLLREKIPGGSDMTKAEIKDVIARDPNLIGKLADSGVSVFL